MNAPSSAGFNPEIRDLRRSEGAQFIEFTVQNAGRLDRDVGLLDRSIRELATSFRPGVWFLLRILRAFGRAPVRLLVSVNTGRIIGTTIVGYPRPWAYVAGVATSQDYRRHGVAQRLMVHAEGLARRTRSKWLVLDVEADNEPARGLYRKLGWSDVVQTDWWRVEQAPETTGAALGGKDGCRTATSAEVAYTRARVESELGIPLLENRILPIEFALQPLRGTRSDWACGPAGSPTYLARTIGSEPGDAAYILGVSNPGASVTDALCVLRNAWSRVRQTNPERILAVVSRSDEVSTDALTKAGSTLVTSSMTMAKKL